MSSECPSNLSFAQSLEKLGARRTIKVIEAHLRSPTEVEVEKAAREGVDQEINNQGQDDSNNPPTNREQAKEALKFIAEGTESTMRKISVNALLFKNGISNAVRIRTEAVSSLQDLDIFTEHIGRRTAPSSSEETHKAVLAIAESSPSDTSSTQEINIALLAYVRDFFPLFAIQEWLQQVLRTITVSNTYMLQLIHLEFPASMKALGDLVFADRIRLLDDKLSTVNDVKTIHLTVK